jgi:FkbM family methyltransferase
MILIHLATLLPRGGFQIVRRLAKEPVLLDTIAGRIWADLTDPAAYPLLKHGTYPHAAPEIAWMRAPKPGQLVLDVGANLGFTASLFHEAGAEVIAFEPSPRTFALLERTAAGRFECRQLALSDKVGSVRFSEHFSSDASQVVETGGTEVPAVTIDSLGLSPSIIKIDVERHEAAVLRGAVETMRRCQPTLLLEAYPEETADECREIIRQIDPDYRMTRLHGCNFVVEVPAVREDEARHLADIPRRAGAIDRREHSPAAGHG